VVVCRHADARARWPGIRMLTALVRWPPGAPHLSMVKDPGLVTGVILKAIKATA